jgi:hypothetical protein
MAAGVGGWSADCIPAPRPSGLRIARDQEVERLETLGFAKVCVRFRRERRARPECPKGRDEGRVTEAE